MGAALVDTPVMSMCQGQVATRGRPTVSRAHLGPQQRATTCNNVPARLETRDGSRMIRATGQNTRVSDESPVSFKAHARELGDVAIIDASGSLTLGSGGTALRDLVHVLASKGQKKFLLNLRE